MEFGLISQEHITMDGNQIILILERDLSLFKLIKNPVRDHLSAVRIIHTNSLDEFLKLIRAVNPKLIIIDFDLADTEGSPLLEALRAKSKQTQILMLLDDHKSEFMRKIMGTVASGFIHKTPEALERLADRIIGMLKGISRVYEGQGDVDVYRELFENASECIFRLNESGYLTLVNYAGTRLTGFSRDELIGKHWTSFFDKSEVVEIKRRLERDGKVQAVNHMQSWLLSRSGNKISIGMSINPVTKSERLYGYQGIIRHLTPHIEHEDVQKRQNYEELIEKNRHLEELNNLKTQFLSTVSHELRTPMNAILGYAELLLEQLYGNVNEAQGNALKNIIDSGNHLLKLINELLDFARIQNGKFQLFRESYPVMDIIDAAIATIKPSIDEKKLKFISEVEDDLPILFIDAQKIHQVLLNLLSNAAKFTDHGTVELNVYRNGDNLEFMIRDTGIGIADHDTEKIFEDFAQVDGSISRSYGGAGLGLSLAKHLVNLHDGEIWVKSVPKKGSAFYFTLPIDQRIDSKVVSTIADAQVQKTT